MPARSKAQARLPLARSIRASMTHQQMHDFAATPRRGLPTHVAAPTPVRPAAGGIAAARASHPAASRLGKYLHPKGGY